MTQDDKDLLLQDLCARLPYSVKVESVFINTDTKKRKLCGIEIFDATCILMIRDGFGEFKPYLFPLSSMTEEQKQEYTYIVNYISPDDTDNLKEGEFIYVEQCVQLLYFYHINHLDYRGLIEKGLAIDATGKGIY